MDAICCVWQAIDSLAGITFWCCGRTASHTKWLRSSAVGSICRCRNSKYIIFDSFQYFSLSFHIWCTILWCLCAYGLCHWSADASTSCYSSTASRRPTNGLRSSVDSVCCRRVGITKYDIFDICQCSSYSLNIWHTTFRDYGLWHWSAVTSTSCYIRYHTASHANWLKWSVCCWIRHKPAWCCDTLTSGAACCRWHCSTKFFAAVAC